MKALRAGICGVIAFAVLSHGAVEDWAQSVVECSAGILLVYCSEISICQEGRAIVLPALFFPLARLLWCWLVGPAPDGILVHDPL
jgi:hypothetical protein